MQVSITTVHRWQKKLGWSLKRTKYCQLILEANLEKKPLVSLDQSPFGRSVSRSVSQSVGQSVSQPVNARKLAGFYEKYRMYVRMHLQYVHTYRLTYYTVLGLEDGLPLAQPHGPAHVTWVVFGHVYHLGRKQYGENPMAIR